MPNGKRGPESLILTLRTSLTFPSTLSRYSPSEQQINLTSYFSFVSVLLPFGAPVLHAGKSQPYEGVKIIRTGCLERTLSFVSHSFPHPPSAIQSRSRSRGATENFKVSQFQSSVISCFCFGCFASESS